MPRSRSLSALSFPASMQCWMGVSPRRHGRDSTCEPGLRLCHRCTKEVTFFWGGGRGHADRSSVSSECAVERSKARQASTSAPSIVAHKKKRIPTSTSTSTSTEAVHANSNFYEALISQVSNINSIARVCVVCSMFGGFRLEGPPD